MNTVDHFTIPLPALGYIVSFLRVGDRLGYHGSVMERTDSGFKEKGKAVSYFHNINEDATPQQLKDTCEILAGHASVALVHTKYGEQRLDEQETLDATLLEAIKARPVWS